MTANLATKDATVVNFVNELQKRISEDTYVCVDHWTRDPFAIGIASKSESRTLVYVSTFDAEPGRYHIQLEFPPDAKSQVAFKEGPHVANVSFDKVLEVIVMHTKAVPKPQAK